MLSKVRLITLSALLIVSLMLVLGASTASAQGPSPKGAQSVRGLFPSYSSSINLQNLSSTTANITITYYNPNGTTGTASPVSDTIAGNSVKTYFPIPGVTAGFNGSAVISSDQPVAAIVNVIGGSFSALDSYGGATAGAATVSLPLLMKNNSGISTWFNVQNAGSADATVNVAYSDGSPAPAAVTIHPGASATFNQASEAHNAAVFSGSVTNSTTNQPLVVAALEETTKTMSAYTGFSGGSTNPVMPLINIQPAIHILSGVTIQNTGGSATSVTVSYTPAAAPIGAGTACTETQSVPAHGNKVFALFAFASGTNSNCAAGSKFVGSAQVTANSAGQPLAVIVNQSVPGASDGAYAGFNPSAATNKIVMPLIMDRNSGIYTSFSLMNVGTGSTSVTCSFTGGVSYTAGTPITLAAGGSFTVLQANQIKSGYVGAGTCTASGAGDKIVAVVNQLGPGTGDQLLVYNAINQ